MNGSTQTFARLVHGLLEQFVAVCLEPVKPLDGLLKLRSRVVGPACQASSPRLLFLHPAL